MNISLLLAATTSPERAVWLCFLFYFLNVLVPIVPAVVIYRLFPEGKTNATPKPRRRRSGRVETDEDGGSQNSIEGGVGGWKIKAVGAWGAYVTTFVLSYWAINATAVPLIKAVGGASVWEIDSHFKMLDEEGKEVQATVDKLLVDPPMVKPWGNRAWIRVTSETLDPPGSVNMELDGYERATVDIDPTNASGGKIKLPTVTFKRLPPLKSGTPPPALRQGEGPPPITAQN